MYGDTIKVANKIITDKDLEDIFFKMFEEMEMCQNQCKTETMQNEKYEIENQNWTVKDYSGTFKVDVNFYDDTCIHFDNFQNFMSIYNIRLHEIKNFYLRCHVSYWRKIQGQQQTLISQYINMDVYEQRMNIEVKLDSEDKIMNPVYDFIKQKILAAPEKYDRVIKKKSSITNKIGFAIGAIPTIILLTLLAFVPFIRQIYAMTYLVYPLVCLSVSFLIGNTFCTGKLNRLYKNIVPEQKYAGFDSTNCKSMYKDDIDKYIETSEILIGKNVENLKNRNEIKELEEKYSKYIPKEIIVILVLSLIVVLIGKFI